MNQCNFVGRIGSIETKEFETGSVTNFSLAVNDGYYSKKEEKWIDRTEWIRCVIYKKSKYKKGDLIAIDGKMKTRKYTGRDDIERYTTEVIVFKTEFLNRKEQSANNDSQSTQNNQSEANIEPPSDDLPY